MGVRRIDDWKAILDARLLTKVVLIVAVVEGEGREGRLIGTVERVGESTCGCLASVVVGTIRGGSARGRRSGSLSRAGT